MRGLKPRLLLILTVFLISIPAYAIAAPRVDPSPPANIFEWGAFYDYRNSDSWRASQGGSEAVSGAYLQIYVGVQIDLTKNPLFDNYDRVVSVTAVHRESGLQFDLIGDDPCTTFAGTPERFWAIFVRPSPFFLNGTWDFTLTYKANDKSGKHQQIISWPMGQMPFPAKPSNIQLTTDGSGDFLVSWNAIGNPSLPHPTVRYRIRLYDEQRSCVEREYRGPNGPCGYYKLCDNTGSYDDTSNRITFTIPAEFAGRMIRLENQMFFGNQSGRACQYMTLD